MTRSCIKWLGLTSKQLPSFPFLFFPFLFGGEWEWGLWLVSGTLGTKPPIPYLVIPPSCPSARSNFFVKYFFYFFILSQTFAQTQEYEVAQAGRAGRREETQSPSPRRPTPFWAPPAGFPGAAWSAQPRWERCLGVPHTGGRAGALNLEGKPQSYLQSAGA